jgi:hypothetical protein
VAAFALLSVAAATAAAGEPATQAGRAAPQIEQMVVFKSGRSKITRVRARRTSVRVEGRRCRIAARTALAALVRTWFGRIRLRDDFGSCPRSAAGLYVVRIGPDAEGRLGAGGWVYKVGRRAATAGAGDPSGPFGRGRLRRGQRVLWFYCRQAGNCQRTLEVRPTVEPDGALAARVTGYNDNGRGVPVEGATVKVGSVELETDADGVARTSLAPGRYRIVATKAGLVRSFPERVTVG